jgi:transketolase
VIRPADANETVVAWRVALERADGPVALLLSRQTIPVLDRERLAGAEQLTRGGYVLWDSNGTTAGADGAGPGADGAGGGADGAGRGEEGGAEPQLILISTGAEVGPTLQAGELLAGEGVVVRVVSMPCIELFEAQPHGYHEQVLPSAVHARLAVEPGSPMSWWKLVGSGGGVVGLERFGASAPGSTVLKELGFSAESIASRARELLRQVSAVAQ